jgi:hypothetical protein
MGRGGQMNGGARGTPHHAVWFRIKRRGGCFGDSPVPSSSPSSSSSSSSSPLNDRLVHLRVSTVARRRKFQGGAFSAMGSAKASVDSRVGALQQGRERVLVGQHHQQEMEEDDDAQSHDEDQRRRKQRTDGRQLQQHSRVVRWTGERRRMSWGRRERRARGGRFTHTCHRHDLTESLYQVRSRRRLMGGVHQRLRFVRECRGLRNLPFILRIFTHSF